MIVIKHLSKSYGAERALDDVSLTFTDGLITGLLGINGAGKTTLLSILATTLHYDSGEVFVFGEPLTNSTTIRGMLATIPQNLAFYDQLTVAENLDFFAAMLHLGARKNERLTFVIEASQLAPLLSRRAATLSGGEKRRLNIAIGLLGDPKIMLFDEPTVGLDTCIRLELLAQIRALKQPGRVIVYTSHYLDEIEKLCDEAAILHEGQIKAFSNQEELRSCEQSLENRFLEITERS